jgi:hypothetical protein
MQRSLPSGALESADATTRSDAWTHRVDLLVITVVCLI